MKTPWLLLSALLLGCGGSTLPGGGAGEGPSGSTSSSGSLGAAGGATTSSGSGGSAATGSGGSNGGGTSGGSSSGGSDAPDASAGTGGSGGNAGSGSAGGDSGGSGGTPMRDAGAAGAECAVDDDCRLFSDCCSCAGVPKTAGVSTCPALCKQSKCEELGLAGGKASCVAGRCVAGFECDGTKVTCDMGPPKCQGGQVPLVSGGCYQGSCVPAVECASVSNCAVCAGRTTCAVFVQRSGSLRHCVDVPPACGGDSTCTCTGKSVCTGIFSRCTNFSGVRGFVCGCPTC